MTKAIVEHNGETLEFGADIFAVCCGAINSAALLLRSVNDKHPDGLANSSDRVGRHYMSHHTSSLIAISKEPNYNASNSSRFKAVAANNSFGLFFKSS